MILKTSFTLTVQPAPMFGRGWNLASAPGKTLADYQAIAATGANLTRFGFVLTADANGILQYAPGTLQESANHIRLSAQCGMDLVLAFCLDPWPSSTSPFWSSPAQQDSLIQRWQELAVAWLPHRNVSFDILNEGQHSAWSALAPRVIRAIRAIDPSRVIVYEPPLAADPYYFGGMAPLPFDGIVYSPHMYDPHPYTHQAIYDSSPAPTYVPGAATTYLQPVIDFQHRYNVPIYVGEFGCIRWAPHRLEYISEVLAVLVAQGWGWSYHAWGEWEGWDAQCNADRNDVTRRVTERTYLVLASALRGVT